MDYSKTLEAIHRKLDFIAYTLFGGIGLLVAIAVMAVTHANS